MLGVGQWQAIYNWCSVTMYVLQIRDRTGLIMLLDLFLVHLFFNCSVCSVWWTELATRQLFTARQIHNIISYHNVHGM